MDPYLSIVVPLYNEEESVEKFVMEVLKVGKGFDFTYEIILIDDGSDDNTWEIIKELKSRTKNLRLIKLRCNYGQTTAMVAGFNDARGKVIVTIDGDLQNDPFDIPLLLAQLNEGYDIVSGWRLYRKDNFFRVFLSKIANSIISLTTGVHLHDYGCSLKAYRAECIKSIEAYGEMHRFFPALARMTGARIKEVIVKHHKRKYGKSKYGFDRIFKVLSDILVINLIIRFSSNPLMGFVLCALPFVFFGLFFGILSLMALIFHWSHGKDIFFMIAAALNWVAVIHLVMLGILGELVVSTSDLSYTQLPEVTKNRILLDDHKEKFQDENNKILVNEDKIAIHN